MPTVLATWEAEIGRIMVRDDSLQRPHIHIQNNQSKVDWRHGSKGRAPALLAGKP
jgi:hypothetical protein